MTIRLEQPGDWREVENLTREAFWNEYRPGCTEHCSQFVDEVNKGAEKPMTKEDYKAMMPSPSSLSSITQAPSLMPRKPFRLR